jgi:hypothetical protein
MKKPIHGDELTLRYQGMTLKAICNEVMELPDRGAGAAKFTITSRTMFRRDEEAFLLMRGDEMALKVERVTNLPHKQLYIISLFGLFGGQSVASAPAPAPQVAQAAP